jgi:hypothetical protein
MPDLIARLPLAELSVLNFSEHLISQYVDMWKPFDFAGVTGFNPTQKNYIEAVITDKLRVLLTGTSTIIPGIDVELNLLDMPIRDGIEYNHLISYFESQLYFIIAKHCFLKNKGSYSKEGLYKDLNDFYEATKDCVANTFLYVIDWFSVYSRNKVLYVDSIDTFIRLQSSAITIILNTYTDISYAEDIFMLLSVKGDASLRRLFGRDLVSSDDDAIIFNANAIIDDDSFKRKIFPSYAILNSLKTVNNINIESFYNFYTNDETIEGTGDYISNSSNYYDLATGHKFMPRYNKLTWNPIVGGSGINTIIVPISGNISNVSELQISNEFYFSQVFRKDYDEYTTVCSSSMDKFIKSHFWNLITGQLIGKNTVDLVDNKVFVDDHSMLVRRSEEQPRLQYVGYLIHKYKFDGSNWRLREVIIIDNCSTSIYYDFNVLYNKRYKYKIATILKWVYSTSITEVESFYSDATLIETAPVSIPATTLPIPDFGVSVPPSPEYVALEGLAVMGSSEEYAHRVDEIAGEVSRVDEESRTATAEKDLSSIVTSIGMSLSSMLER